MVRNYDMLYAIVICIVLCQISHNESVLEKNLSAVEFPSKGVLRFLFDSSLGISYSPGRELGCCKSVGRHRSTNFRYFCLLTPEHRYGTDIRH